MNRSKIEWTEYTSNPVRGECPVGCSYCYVKSFRKRYGWHKDIRFYPQELEAIRRRKKPSRIFIGSTIELFHEKTIQYMPEIMETVKDCPQHTFMFLTKQPQNLAKWSSFPENCWVGVTVCNMAMYREAIVCLSGVEAKVKYISFEPLLDEIVPEYAYDVAGEIQWAIIGAQTKPFRPPKISWVQEILVACSNASNIPVFMKDNLQPLLDASPGWGGWKLRQEMPE